jgi:deoxycytidylate deaminase
LTTSDGDLIAAGTNEVPKPGGGQYWEDDEPDNRDHNRDDPDISGTEKRTVAEQILNRLREAGWLASEQAGVKAEDFFELTSGLRVRGLIEFERAVHAEMAAVVDAGRRGVAIRGAHLYTTTFPCHECTRHVIAAGIERVVYIEPYPKSLAARLHDDALAIDQADPKPPRVRFEPFVGVAPRRYLESFTAKPGERKDNGRVRQARPGWFPKVLPRAEPPLAQPGVELVGSQDDEDMHGREVSALRGEGSSTGEVDVRFDERGQPDSAESVEGAEEARDHDERNMQRGNDLKATGETEEGAEDLSDVGSEEPGLAAEGAPDYPSEALYIVREANTLVELDDVLRKSELEIKEAEDGERGEAAP